MKRLFKSHSCNCPRCQRSFHMLMLQVVFYTALMILFVGLWDIHLGDAVGWYSPDHGWIDDFIVVLPVDDSYSANLHTAEHELGHWFWYEKLNESQRVSYAEIHNLTREFPSLLYTGTYASTSAEEDFAEQFAVATQCVFDADFIEWDVDRREFFGREVIPILLSSWDVNATVYR